MAHIPNALASHPVPELNIQNKQSLKIHVVQAGKEFDLVMVFWVSHPRPEGWVFWYGGGHRVEPRSVLLSVLQELLVLLPHVALELQFVGDGLPPESDQQHFTLQRVRAEGALLFSPDPSSDLLVGPCPSAPTTSHLAWCILQFPDFQWLLHPTPGPSGWPRGVCPSWFWHISTAQLWH